MRFGRQSPEIYAIDPAQLSINVESDKPIAESESRVFAGSNADGTACVLKVYDKAASPHLTVEFLRTYQHLTTLVGDQLSHQSGKIRVSHGEIPFQWGVVPVGDVGTLLGHQYTVCTVSEYVPGHTLLDVLEGEVPSAGIGFYQMLLRQKEQIGDFLRGIDTRLNRSLQTDVILLAPWNIKVSSPDSDRLVLTATDVCGWVSSLIPEKKHFWDRSR